MIKKIPRKKRIIFKMFLFKIVLMVNIATIYGQTAPPAPSGNMSQYFCSATSWMNAGFSESGDTFDELQVYGEDLTFYEDNGGAPGNVISNPSNFVLVDGATYYVTQTIGGVESDPLTITVNDRECGCIKNPKFETSDGQPTDEGYVYYDESYADGHKTCGGSIAGLSPIALGTMDNMADVVALVSSGSDPNVVTANLPRTSPLNANSDYGLRLGNGLNTAPGSNTYNGRVEHMTKEFVAGEVFMFNFSAILNNPPGHTYDQQPYMFVKIYDENDEVVAARCLVSSDTDCIFKQANNEPTTSYTYTLYNEWSCLKINTLNIIGQKARVEFTIADCKQSGHWGYVYLDDFFVGDNIDSGCSDPSFGYIAMESVQANSQTLDCVVDVAGTAQSCGADINASVPFPIDVCGTIKTPISNSNPPNIDDLVLTITQNGTQVGSVANPTITGDQFCFTIDASDINVSPYGEFEVSSTIDYSLDCGDPYEIVLNDRATIDVCPTIASCVAPLETCDDTGNGIGIFDLTETEDQILGSDWTSADVDIAFYESDIDAVDEQNVITNPGSYENTVPEGQLIYARLDWHPQGTTTNCFYILAVDVSVYTDPILDIPSEIVQCGNGTFNVPIIATPTNINELTDVSYTWRRNGDLMAFSGSYYAAKQPGTYEITVSEENCSTTQTVAVKRIDFEVDLGDEDPIQVCGNNETVTLTANIIDSSSPAIDESNLNYLWSTGETTKSIEVSESNVYTVEVDYNGECMKQKSVDVLIATEPDIASLSDFEMCTMDEVEVTATLNNLTEQESEFVWYRDGQVLPGEISSTITVGEEGVYTVEVNEVGYDFCFTSEEFTAEYYDNADCVITQGLSPDVTIGQNDCLDLKFLSDRTGITNIKLYSRYGRLVFDENDYVDSFCGQDMDGDVLPTGTYYYVLVLDAEDPIFEKVIKGWIYINREAN